METIANFHINLAEEDVLWPLGYKDMIPGQEILECVRDEIARCNEYMRPELIYEKINIHHTGMDRVLLENQAVFEGRYIAEKLKNCQYVVLAAATLGGEIDSIIQNCFDSGQYLKGMVIDTIGSAAIEYVNRVFRGKLLDEIKGTDMGMTIRLSPGTGDWDISHQAVFFKCINAEAIGITLTKENMMLPLKSTSVLYGFGRGIGIKGEEHICSECNMKECSYSTDKIEVIIKDDKNRKVVYGSRGASLLEVLRKEGITPESPCGGKGTCGKCKILVKAWAGKPSDIDAKHLSEEELNQGIRLACAFKLFNPVEIEIPHSDKGMNIITEGSNIDFKIEPLLAKKHLKLAPPSLKDQRSDVKRIMDALEDQNLNIRNELVPKIPGILREGEFTAKAVLYKNILIDLEYSDSKDDAYGIALDIGTTTIACYLVDLFTGKVLDIESSVNSQRSYGADIISRINYTMDMEKGLSILKDAVLSQINSMILSLSRRNNINIQNIYNMSVVGNTTMIHLFLGIPCSSIAFSPYIPVTTNPMDVHGGEAGIGINGYVSVMPGVSGFVGSDITAGILACGIHKSKGYSLLLDLGTNGEMALGSREGIITCSTAAGPAFEGASIKWGSGGVKGAISRVDLSREKIYETIGGVSPRTICGSGVLDMVSELLKYGLIDKTGRMTALEEPGYPERFKDRMAVKMGMKEFIIDEGITFTQKDVREVQLAKAAVSAGIRILLEEVGINPCDVENIFIAGGFGSYMSAESALNIGLIPMEFQGRCRTVGNSAGTGARMCLLSKACREEIESIASGTRYIELSGRMDFQQYYIESMDLGR